MVFSARARELHFLTECALQIGDVGFERHGFWEAVSVSLLETEKSEYHGVCGFVFQCYF